MPKTLCSYIKSLVASVTLITFLVVTISAILYAFLYAGYVVFEYTIRSLFSDLSLYQVIVQGVYVKGDIATDSDAALSFILTWTFIIMSSIYFLYGIIKVLLQLLFNTVGRIKVSISGEESTTQTGSLVQILGMHYSSIKEGICQTLNYVDGEKENGNKN